MDRRNKPMSREEQLMEQVLSGFQRLLLSPPGAGSDQQDPEDSAPVSEFDLIDPEVAAAEINHMINNFRWRQNRPHDEDCTFMWNYCNLTMQVMEDLHEEHSQKSTNAMEKSSLPFGTFTQSPSLPTSVSSPIASDFKCSTCREMFSLLYENFASDQPLPRGTHDNLSTPLPPDFDQPSSSYTWRSNTVSEPLYHDESEDSIRPQRPSLSPLPTSPLISRQYDFGFSDQATIVEDRVSTSPVPNLPSTSRSCVFVRTTSPGESNQVVPSQVMTTNKPHSPPSQASIDNERKKKFLRIKKEKSMQKRRTKK